MMQSVQIIIERLKSNPEEFFGDINEMKGLGIKYPKFHSITDKLDNLLTENQDGQVHRLWYLEPEEKEALIAAYKEARRARFEASVFHTLLSRQEEDKGVALQNRVHPRTGKVLMQGFTDPQTWQMAVPIDEGKQI